MNYLLTLYIAGHTTRSQRAVENLKQILNDQTATEYELDIVDVLERPDLAEEKKILTTPVVIKKQPPPEQRVIGDFSDREKVLFGLNLQS